ncbi:helix-turn-helix transcriptional regulator [Methylorubrum rhodesianum]|uniref:Helix-turn-helix transcriptional regulator n=1 Tax=Methylorubrum rhodesianum TaxID=29427 RepID=A0ABU9ZHQ8_9HYPH|nr:MULTISPECIES: helix-turn-helix transcriptional regulator [Methylorubrum]MBY0141110.1 helix-turn-helix transcriptional regulator [Methylorubrum populi]MRI55808.1 XRE family transcriptional regulator [Methylobacterium sp. DB1607]MBB5765181.1 ribosome-binding protein aMBF1 (putative translation factor) [Methylorubrum rhodesianum]MBI1687649.1 XRE family transcriptional regulator [Methylorubrum sp. DB1722]MBK3401898.1 helix-turn-helix transcriptional regulator [Methylorubrum rhodesianum]
MTRQIITTPGGERLVLMPEADFEALVAAAEDNADRTAVAEFRRKLAAGDEELLPAALVERLVSGENRVRIWREHRGLSGAALAKQAGLAQAYLSQIETGAREGTVETYGKLAAALGVSLDDLVG